MGGHLNKWTIEAHADAPQLRTRSAQHELGILVTLWWTSDGVDLISRITSSRRNLECVK